MLTIQIKDNSRYTSVDKNPIARYGHFCEVYNSSCNIVEGKAYEVPDLSSSGYKLYRSLWKWWTVGWRQFVSPGECCGGINCESPCCIFETFFYILCVLYPIALIGLSLASGILFLIAAFDNNNDRKTQFQYFQAFCVLVPTVIGYLVPVLCFGYTVCYMQKLTNLVERNFNLVPRNRVFSNMIYVRNLDKTNKFLEISGHLAAALRRSELSYDQINDQAILK